MKPRALGIAALSLVAVLGPAVVAADREPLHHATFSLCAIDPRTGESGVAVTTRVPFVGRAVPWARAGVGAVATQSWTIVEYGRQGLDLLQEDVEPEQAIERLLADDAGRELRQIGLIDMQGRSAAFTGKENSDWAGSRQGPNYTVQGNILVGQVVVDAVADHFESTEGSGMPLAERLILALEAGQHLGGDQRWGNFQSAAIRVADPNDPGRGGDHLSVSIDVGEHPTPVLEMKRIYRTTQRRLGYRTLSEIRGPDVLELKRKLQKLGYWKADEPPIPETPSFDVDRQLSRNDPAEFEKQVAAYGESWRELMTEHGTFGEGIVAAVDKFREDNGLTHAGNPRGLVDAALVQALDEALAREHRVRDPGSETGRK